LALTVRGHVALNDLEVLCNNSLIAKENYFIATEHFINQLEHVKAAPLHLKTG